MSTAIRGNCRTCGEGGVLPELSVGCRIIRMRAYTVATAAVALGVRTKWVDNVLSHRSVPGVSQSRQGVTRRLTVEAVSVLEIALRLTRGFGIPLNRSLDLAVSAANRGSPVLREAP